MEAVCLSVANEYISLHNTIQYNIYHNGPCKLADFKLVFSSKEN